MKKVLFYLLLLVLAPIAVLIIITPMDSQKQYIFGLVSIGILFLLGFSKKHSISVVMMVVSALMSTRYIYFRATQTLHFNSEIEAILGIGLFLAELYIWVILLLTYLQTVFPLKRGIVPLPDDVSLWPTVDIYIPSYNESLDVVRDTVLAAQCIDYPKDKLNIYLLDDGKRREFAVFAADAGVGYITRTDNSHAKAGNLNHALKLTKGELICVFDCDHVATRIFLQATVGSFLQDPKLALLQTPHYFYSPDPFERNLSLGKNIPNEGSLFYGPIQQGNDNWNATFFCGSCAVIRRSALEEIGGFAVETVTEDAHTALKMQRLGWKSAFLAIPLAAGLATERLVLHVIQRTRWARGMTQIFRMDNPLFGRGLTWQQRCCYLSAMLYFQFALPRVAFLTAPLAYLLFNLNIIHSFVGRPDIRLCPAASAVDHLPQLADERALSLQFLGRNLRYRAGVPSDPANRNHNDFSEAWQIQRDGQRRPAQYRLLRFHRGAPAPDRRHLTDHRHYRRSGEGLCPRLLCRRSKGYRAQRGMGHLQPGVPAGSHRRRAGNPTDA